MEILAKKFWGECGIGVVSPPRLTVDRVRLTGKEIASRRFLSIFDYDCYIFYELSLAVEINKSFELPVRRRITQS